MITTESHLNSLTETTLEMTTTFATEEQDTDVSYTAAMRCFKKKAQKVPVALAVAHMPGDKDRAAMFVERLSAHTEALLPWAEISASTVSLSSKSLSDNIRTLAWYESTTDAAMQLGNSFILTPGWVNTEIVLRARECSVLRSKQLFALSGDPSALVHYFEKSSSDGSLGGVYGKPGKAERLYHILSAVCQVQSVCLAFDPLLMSRIERETVESTVAEIKEFFAMHNTKVIVHNWVPEDSFLDNLERKLAQCNAVITLNESTALIHGQKVTELCNKLNKTHQASTLDLVFRGAAVGHGYSVADYCTYLGQIMSCALIDPLAGCETHVLPVREEGHYNYNAFAKQGIVLTKREEELLKMRSVFDQ